MTNSYLVWRCPGCKRYQSSIPKTRDILKIVLKCRSCGKSTKLKRSREIGLSVECSRYESGQDAACAVSNLNKDVNL